MRLSTVLASALTLGWTAAQCAGPVVSKLSACPTVDAFCSSVLETSVVTTTKPKSVFTYKQVITTTISHTLKIPTLVVTTSSYTCAEQTSTLPARMMKREAALGPSCGVGSSPASDVSSACSCFVTATVMTTVTKTQKAGTSIMFTTMTKTAQVTSTKYGTTTTQTHTVVIEADCAIPPNATCLGPSTCYDYYDTYECGSNGIYECACGYNPDFAAVCFQSAYCSDLAVCETDADCYPYPGQFCLIESCCSTSVCSLWDVCLGDQPAAVPHVVRGANSNSGFSPIAKRGLLEDDMTPWGRRHRF